jgi:hypothetical protein
MRNLLPSPTVAAGSLAARPQPTLTVGGGVLLRPWSPGDARTASGYLPSTRSRVSRVVLIFQAPSVFS